VEALNQTLERLASLLADAGWIAPLIAFIAGVVTGLLPCTLPVIPLIIGYVGGTEAEGKRALRMSALFALGMAITVTVLGVVAALLGRLLVLSGNWFYLVLGVLMVLMALQLFGVYEFIPSAYLTGKAQRRGYLGALLAGILGGLFASPCSTPVLVVLLGLVATSGNLVWSIVLLLSYAFGTGVIVLAVGASVGFARSLMSSPRYASLARAIEIGLGLLTLALALYLFYLGF